jgi:hypothetical protein
MGSAAANRVREIANLAKELPENELQELLDFAEFLKIKKQGFSYKQVADSAEYVKKIRTKEGKKAEYGQTFINELIEWQKSNSVD